MVEEYQRKIYYQYCKLSLIETDNIENQAHKECFKLISQDIAFYEIQK